MWDACKQLWSLFLGLFRSRASLEAENLALRQQIIVLQRTAPKRLCFNTLDRVIFVGLYRLFPDLRDALAVVRPETVVRWHRAGFRAYWRRRSRPRRGRPTVPHEIRQLIREMSLANPLWGAPRIHGELLKLGIAIGQTSVAKYMPRRRGPPSQGWRTFLRNHADGIAAMDLFVVPTISFRLLYGLLILRHDRRRLLWLATTTHPTSVPPDFKASQEIDIPRSTSDILTRKTSSPAYSTARTLNSSAPVTNAIVKPTTAIGTRTRARGCLLIVGQTPIRRKLRGIVEPISKPTPKICRPDSLGLSTGGRVGNRLDFIDGPQQRLAAPSVGDRAAIPLAQSAAKSPSERSAAAQGATPVATAVTPSSASADLRKTRLRLLGLPRLTPGSAKPARGPILASNRQASLRHRLTAPTFAPLTIRGPDAPNQSEKSRLATG